MGKVDCGQSPKRALEPILANYGQTNWWVVQIYPMAWLVIVHITRPVCSPLSLFRVPYEPIKTYALHIAYCVATERRQLPGAQR